jgi:two-component system, OmpR family, sensor kinase
MEGVKRRLSESVEARLSLALSLAILVVAVIAGIFSFLNAFNEAQELQDDVLRGVASAIDRQSVSQAPPADLADRNGDVDSRVIIQRLGAPGVELALPQALADGMYTLDVAGEPYRVFVKTTSTGEHIAVAQETEFRNENAQYAAVRSTVPLVVLVPILIALIVYLVRQMFRPIAALSREIHLRPETDLHPLEERGLPAEIRPFVVAINQLLFRVSHSMESQRRFIADAAHELRSPMTALSLQAESLATSEVPPVVGERVAKLRRGIDRARNLLEQLLTLARVQTVSERMSAPVSVLRVYRRVLEDLIPLADAKQIDIGVEGSEEIKVTANELDLITLVRNLVDNAIRYTKPGGHVYLAIRSANDHIELQICDTGPGIAHSERDCVFDAFYRTLGSDEVGAGLGLSIVKSIADRMRATLRLEFGDPANESGLCISVAIPNHESRAGAAELTGN